MTSQNKTIHLLSSTGLSEATMRFYTKEDADMHLDNMIKLMESPEVHETVINFHKRVNRVKELKSVLIAIAGGYKTKGIEDRYISVQNPEHTPENGHDPYLVLDMEEFESIVWGN